MVEFSAANAITPLFGGSMPRLRHRAMAGGKGVGCAVAGGEGVGCAVAGGERVGVGGDEVQGGLE